MKLSILLSLLCGSAASTAAELEFYRDVYPFLKNNCISCHNKTTTKADLNMETPELMIKGGESGPALIPGKGAESLVVAASMHSQDMEMPPPNNKSGAVDLTPEQISLLKQWIDQGAKAGAQQERAVTWQALTASVDPIYTVAVTKDGRYAACGRSNRIFIYDLATRQLVAQVSDPREKDGAAHRALVQSLAFSPDGTQLASGSYREVKLWKLAVQAVTGEALSPAPVDAAQLQKLAQAAKVVTTCSAASKHGKKVIAGCSDGAVRVWDLNNGKLQVELRGSVATQKQLSALEWTVAAQTLEQAFQKSEITRIETQDKALDVLLGKAKDAIAAMKKVLPEKQKAVQPTLDAKAAAQKAVDDLAAKVAQSAAGKPDAALDKQFKDAQDKLITAKMSEVSALAAVTAAESNVKDAEDDLKRIEESKAKNVKEVAQANAAIAKAKSILDKTNAEVAALKTAHGKVTAKPVTVAFSQDEQRAAAFFEDGTLRVWAVATGLPLDETNTSTAKTATTFTTTSSGSFTLTKTVSLTLSPGKPQWKLERQLADHSLFADRVNAVRFSPDGKTLATGGGELSRSGDITFFDVTSGQVKQRWKERHADTVLCLDFSPDGRYLASGGADKIARVSEVATGKTANTFEGHTHHVMGVAFRSDGRVLATAGADGLVLSWDLLMGERKKKIEGWTKEVTSVQFIGATNQLVTSAGDNRVRVVTDDGTEVRSINNLPDYMQASAATPNGATLVAGGEDSVLRVWDGTNGQELAVFDSKAPQP